MGKKQVPSDDVNNGTEGTYHPGAYRVYSPYLFIGRSSSLEEELRTPLTIGNRFEWIFANMNFTLGLGPFWRFPIVAYAQGGGSYVVAYTIIFLLVGYPLAFLEIALGQSTRRRASKVFQLCAAFEGLPIAMAIYSLLIPVLYSVLFSYTLFYFYHSFSDVLIWNDCELMNVTLKQHICRNFDDTDKCSNCTYITPQELFWTFKLLGGYKEESERTTLDGLNLPLFACLLMSWLITSIFVFEKVRKYSIKAEYWFAPFLILLMAILLIASIYVAKTSGLENSMRGITDFFVPDMRIFHDLHIWREATQQVFFSLGIGTGPLITVGSLCHFKSPVHVDSAIICAISLFYTFASGILFFLAAGLAQNTVGGDSVLAEQVNIYGSGLFFIAYPNMFSRLPLPQIWGAFFFLIVVAIGTRAVLGTIDTTSSVIGVFLPKKWDFRYKSITITYTVILTSFLLALLCITKRDLFVFYTLYVYPGATILPVLALVESVSVIWIYGVTRFSGDVEYMLGYKPNVFYRTIWLLIPGYLIIMIIGCWSYEWFYDSAETLLPVQFKIAGWLSVIAIFLPIPVKFVMNCMEFHKRKRLKEIFKSRDDFGPDDLELWFRSENTQERKSVSTNASEGDKKVIDISAWTHEVDDDPIDQKPRSTKKPLKSRSIDL